MPSDEVPPELLEWVEARLKLITKTILSAQKIHTAQAEDAHAWTLGLLAELASIETVSDRMVHLLITYGRRNDIATPTELAKASDMTITGAQNRVGGKVAQAAYAEVWPDSR